MSRTLRVCLLGFNAFETDTLGSELRLATPRVPRYEPVFATDEADLLLVDADQSEALAAAIRVGRLEHSVFVGSDPPSDAQGWVRRPVDRQALLRELDLLAEGLGLRAEGHHAEAPTAAEPVARSAPAPLRAAGAPAPRAPAEAPPNGWAEALIVDDSDIAQRFLETRLHREGLHTACASTSQEALALLAKKPFRFVFLDIELGDASEYDGLQVCRALKRRRSATPPPTVVLVSAHHSELDRARGTLAGADGFLAKPLDEALLNRMLAQFRG